MNHKVVELLQEKYHKMLYDMMLDLAQYSIESKDCDMMFPVGRINIHLDGAACVD